MFLESVILMEPVREYPGLISLISMSCEGGRKETTVNCGGVLAARPGPTPSITYKILAGKDIVDAKSAEKCAKRIGPMTDIGPLHRIQQIIRLKRRAKSSWPSFG